MKYFLLSFEYGPHQRIGMRLVQARNLEDAKELMTRGEAVLVCEESVTLEPVSEDRPHFVQCGICGATADQRRWSGTKAKAINTWNSMGKLQ